MSPVKKPKKKKTGGLSARLHFPEAEARLPWLPLLLDAYAIADTGVAVGIRNAEKEQGLKLACMRECDVCCGQKDIPVYPHELVGIYWYATEAIESPQRERVKRQLAAHAGDSSCPFLVDRSCSIHPLRPLSCRQFNVFNAPCTPGEDPYYSRRGDVFEPREDYRDRVFGAVLAFYGAPNGGDMQKAVRRVRAQILNLQTYDWKKLLTKMEDVERRSR